MDFIADMVSAAEYSRVLFALLAKAKIIPSELAKRLEKAVGFRNILVHQYTQIDYSLAYMDLESKLRDLEEFAGYIHKYLESSFR